MFEEDSRHNEATEDYEIGYGKPPKNRQWKKGQSGNPGGARRDTGLDDSLHRIMKRRIKVPHDGEMKNVTVQEALIYRVSHDALKGTSSAQRLLVKLLERSEAERREAIKRSEAEQASRLSEIRKNGGWDIIECRVTVDEMPLYPIREAVQELLAHVRAKGSGAEPAVVNALDKLVSCLRNTYPNWRPGAE